MVTIESLWVHCWVPVDAANNDISLVGLDISVNIDSKYFFLANIQIIFPLIC